MPSGSRTGTETSDAPPAGVMTVSLTMPPGAASMLGRVTGAVPATPESRLCVSAGVWTSTEPPAAPAVKLMVTGWALVLTTIPDSAPASPLARAVSYTHLRAHETDSYLVCRLLLEK